MNKSPILSTYVETNQPRRDELAKEMAEFEKTNKVKVLKAQEAEPLNACGYGHSHIV